MFRKINDAEIENLLREHEDSQKKEAPVEIEIKETSPKQLEHVRLRTDKLDIRHDYKKMLEAFRIDYKHELSSLGKEPRVVVLGADDRAEVNIVFKNARVTNYVESSREAEYRNRLGTPSKKFNTGAQLPDEPADIFIAFYDTDATSKGGRFDFARQIAHGGLLLCRAKMATELLEDSDFEFTGTLTGEGGMEHSQKTKRTDYWEVAVKDDTEFREASAKLKPGSTMMSYDEAADALKAAELPTGEKHNRVLSNYKELYELALKDPATSVKDDGTLVYKHSEMQKPVELKKLPFGTVNDTMIFVLRKRRPGESR